MDALLVNRVRHFVHRHSHKKELLKSSKHICTPNMSCTWAWRWSHFSKSAWVNAHAGQDQEGKSRRRWKEEGPPKIKKTALDLFKDTWSAQQLVVAGSAFSIAPFVALRTRKEKSPSPPVELERGSPSGVLTLLGPQHVKECTGNFVGYYPTHIGLIDSHPHHKMEMSLHFTCSELFYRTILYTTHDYGLCICPNISDIMIYTIHHHSTSTDIHQYISYRYL